MHRIAPVLSNEHAAPAGAPCLDVWGKNPEHDTPYPLLAHLLDCIVTSRTIWDTWLRPGLKDQIADAIAGGDHDRARKIVALLAGLHDVGKANPVFQYQVNVDRDLTWRTRLDNARLPRPSAATINHLTSSGGQALRHEYVGMVRLASTPGHDANPARNQRTFVAEHWAALVVGGHHGRWGEPDDTHDTAHHIVTGTWGDEFTKHRAAVEDAAEIRFSELGELSADIAGKITVLLSGIVVLADWLASDDRQVAAGVRMLSQGARLDESWVNLRSQQNEVSRDKLPLQDARDKFTLREWVTANIGSYRPPVDGPATILGGHQPWPLQAEAVTKVGSTGGMWMVTYPTGEGKTESALLRHVARDDEGIAFALPTRATTDVMTKRLRKTFEGTGNLVLKIHQYASTDRVASDGCTHYGSAWFSSSLRRLISPVAVMTCDQVLAASLKERHSPLRLLAVANHHVVFDEVHTFDHYQTELLTELLSWLGATDTRVTLLSATMPAWMQRAFTTAYTGAGQDAIEQIEYPSHRVVVDADTNHVATTPLSKTSTLTMELDSVTGRDDAHTDWMVEKALTYPDAHVAVIVNTVDAAISIAETVREQLAGTGHGDNVMCLHSRFTHGDREDLQERLVELTGKDSEVPGDRVLLVATQVAEASLDIDFDFMSTDLAPASSLLQRAGRLWRFKDPEKRARRLGGVAAERVLRVVARTTKNGLFSHGVSLPYLAAELARVWNWLAAENGPVRIPEDVQRFVDDTTVSLDDFLDDDSGDGYVPLDPDSAREYASIVQRHEEAAKSKADLTDTISRTVRTKYTNLVDLTALNDKESMMRTRFIDNPGFTYLLIDPSNCRPDLVHRVTIPLADVRTTRGTAVGRLLPATIQVPGGNVDDALQHAHHATMMSAKLANGWKVDPDRGSKVVEHLLPVDVAFLAPELVYNSFTGMMYTGVEAPLTPAGPEVVDVNLDIEEIHQ